MEKIKVLVVDDSPLMRKIISDMVNFEDDMEVMDVACSGEEMLEKILKHPYNVITLDVEMPMLDGIQTLRELKKRNINIPVIMLSSITRKGAHLTIECLEAGAFDFVSKPSIAVSLDINKVKEELVQKIRLAYDNLKKSEVVQEKKEKYNPIVKRKVIKQNEILKKSTKIKAVVIGASTGGPRALYTIITAFPAKLGVPVFVVQHMPVGFTKAFADRLNLNSDIKVVEATDGETIEKDTVYIAPGGFHMEVDVDNCIHLNTEPSIWGVRPAVDKLFLSASKVYGSNLVSVVLTGMGRDGAQGTVEIKKNGGTTLSEHQSTCIIYGMPKATFETGMVDMILPITEIAIQIVKLVN